MNKEIIQLAQQLGRLLKEKDLKIATAESCTGGGIAQAITEVSGSSVWFDRGFVTYSNLAKIQMLQVKQESLDEYGAVSEKVAIEMVNGALINSVADIAVSVTGIAGPTGGTELKPVGVVYIAWKKNGTAARCEKHFFLGGRGQIRLQAVSYALNHCLYSDL
ncbi:MAG: CinA family protein [Methylococcaceae bacterium]|nr:CinA family protein [Methylococcaceae bacterium]